jgi:hypothetical protein
MSSVDLTAAYDLVDVRLLIKRLHIVGLPTDVNKLIKLWCREDCSLSTWMEIHLSC